MSAYSQKIFQSLSDKRKAQIMLKLLHDLEEHWSDEFRRDLLISDLKRYFSGLEKSLPGPELSRILRLKSHVDRQVSLRQILNVSVFLERYLNLSVHHDDIQRNAHQVTCLDRSQSQHSPWPLYVVLDHLRSAFNVGSIFRSSECLGVNHIYLVGYTPTPASLGVKKTAMGAENLVSWTHHDHMESVFEKLKKAGVQCIALETSEMAENLYSFKATKPLAIVLGNERFGLEDKVLDRADQLVKIPMTGQKNSLNVANTFGIVAFEVLRQWQNR